MESEQTTERAAGNRITHSKNRTNQAGRTWAAPMHVRRPRSPNQCPVHGEESIWRSWHVLRVGTSQTEDEAA
jgi:hypothetical protein